MEDEQSKTALYRFYGADDRLMYVGITEQLGTRWEAHMRLKPWWPDVHRQTSEWYPTRAEAAAAEEKAIATEQPRHNVRHSVRLPDNISLTEPWTCPACGWNANDLANQLDHMEQEARRLAGTRLPALRAEYLMRQVVSARRALEKAASSLGQAQAALASARRRGAGRSRRPVTPLRPDVDVDKLLSDLDLVVGADRVRLSRLPDMLRQLDPTCAAYQTIKGTHIGEALRRRGIRITNTDNILRLDPADLRYSAS